MFSSSRTNDYEYFRGGLDFAKSANSAAKFSWIVGLDIVVELVVDVKLLQHITSALSISVMLLLLANDICSAIMLHSAHLYRTSKVDCTVYYIAVNVRRFSILVSRL